MPQPPDPIAAVEPARRWPLPSAGLATLALGAWTWVAAPGGAYWTALALAGAALPLSLALQTRAHRRRARQQAMDTALRMQALQMQTQQLQRAEQLAQLGSFDWNLSDGSLHWSDGHFRLWGLPANEPTPDYPAFCQGPGHGTGYQDQIIIEVRDFLRAIETGSPIWPTFRDGMEVNRIIEAARVSAASRSWVDL